jgi:hypothetical protein
MIRFLELAVVLSFLFLSTALDSFAQSAASITSLTAVPPPQGLVAIPIYAISRNSNVVTVSTVDPDNPDQFAQQSNQVGKNVTIAQVTADPSGAANGTFPICGPPTPGCNTPTTAIFSYVSVGPNFSAATDPSTDTPLGYSAVVRTPCPLIPTGYFSFCGDPLPGAGLTSLTDTSLVEIISTQDSAGTTLWASSLGDGNTGSTRVTGCEQGFIESGNEWHFQCEYQRRLGGYFDIDMRNQWLFLNVGDGVTSNGIGGQFQISGTRKLAAFGVTNSNTLEVDMGTTPSGSVMPTTGILRFRNGSTACWENAAATGALCQTTDSNDRFAFDNGITTATYNTSTACASVSAQCGSAAAGSFTLPPGITTVSISTTAVTPQSQIFIQEDASLGGILGVNCNAAARRSYLVTTRAEKIGFTIEASSAPSGQPACISYHILN